MAHQARGHIKTARVSTIALIGLEGRDVEVEAQIGGGLAAFQIVGLPDKAVAESRERIRAALGAIGAPLPPKRITVNLAPADLAKEGGHFDLPIALALLIAQSLAPSDCVANMLVMGELALDGRIRRVNGALAAAVAAAERRLGLICPHDCAGEAALLADDVEILAPDHLRALWAHLRGEASLPPPPPMEPLDEPTYPDLDEVSGQESVKDALLVAAAGGHNLLLHGPPGSGKSMLAERLPGLLPPLAKADALMVAMIRSVAGERSALSMARPYRAPHHTASAAALVGGGPMARPGEASLAHKGVLFLDELPEFARPALEALRQPLETGAVAIARAQHRAVYPARFQLVAAMNPCRCGFLDDPRRGCGRAPRCGQDYRRRVSGPILDRIDMHVEAPALNPFEMTTRGPSRSSADQRARAIEARDVQRERFAQLGATHLDCNAEADGDVLAAIAPLDEPSIQLLRAAAERFGLSARGHSRVVRLARTIADLDRRAVIDRRDVASAIGYRRSAWSFD